MSYKPIFSRPVGPPPSAHHLLVPLTTKAAGFHEVKNYSPLQKTGVSLSYVCPPAHVLTSIVLPGDNPNRHRAPTTSFPVAQTVVARPAASVSVRDLRAGGFVAHRKYVDSKHDRACRKRRWSADDDVFMRQPHDLNQSPRVRLMQTGVKFNEENIKGKSLWMAAPKTAVARYN